MTPHQASGAGRLAIVLSHPIQYYSPWFRWLREHGGFDLRVFYLWDAGSEPALDPQFGRVVAWDVDLCSGYPHEFVANVARRPGADRFFGLRNPALTARLDTFAPRAVLLFGYAYASHLQVVAWARRRGIPLLFRGDSHLLGRGSLPVWKAGLLRLLYRKFAGFLYTGKANRAYFEALGVPSDRLHFAPHSVDAARFDPSLPEVQRAIEALRRSLPLESDTRVVLFAGKFVPAKQPRPLLDAFLNLAPRKAVLLFAGDGEERANLESTASARGALGRTVFIRPFTNQSAMPALHGLASIFVLPSRGRYETWGLAVNEAMHLGVPALVSDRVGCQSDLVTEGETGWVFSSSDPQGLSTALARALGTSAEARARLGANARQRIAGYTYTQTTAGLRAAWSACVPT